MDATQIMTEIGEAQANIVKLREQRDCIELQLTDLNQQIDSEVGLLAGLQDKLNQAIAQATHKAVGG